MAKNSKEMESAEVETLLNEWNAALEPVPPTTVSSLHPAVAVGLGGFVLLNVGLLLSIPPVLMGRGAPYLPTFRNKLNQMFAPLPKHFASKAKKQLTFVDLGSGDGRVVFRAAREGLFHKSIGYEINPCKCYKKSRLTHCVDSTGSCSHLPHSTAYCHSTIFQS